MDSCFSHFIYGKIIRDGADYSGFSIVEKSEDLPDSRIQAILPQIGVGQIPGWDSFMPVFNLTQNMADNYRAFSYTFKSKVMDVKRGYFPVQHSLLIEGDVFLNYVELARQFALISEKYDYSLADYKETHSLCLDLDDDINKFEWEIYETNKFAILHILDSLFYSKSVVVVTSENNPLQRLAIANAVGLLLPPTLRKQFSYHTNFFGAPEKIKSLLKFTEPTMFDASKHTVIDLRRGDNAVSTSRAIKSVYVNYLSHLLNDVNLHPRDLFSLCSDLFLDGSQFTSDYAKLIGVALKDKIEIPIFLSKIRHHSPDLVLDEILDFFQRPQVFSDVELVKLIWNYLLESKDRSAVNEFIVSHSRFAESVLLENNESLATSWLNHLILTNDINLLDKYLSDSQFLIKNIELVPVILAVFVQFDESFDEKRVAFILENGLKSNNLDYYIEALLSNGAAFAKRKFPATFDFLGLIGGIKTEPKFRGNLIEKLIQEINIDNLIRLSMLGLRTGHFDLLKSELFLFFPKSTLTSQFFATIEKNVEKITVSNLSLEDFGALNAATIIYVGGFLRKLIPVKKLGDSFDNIQAYSLGFARIVDSTKSPTPKDSYTRFVGLLNDLPLLNRAQLYIALVKQTNDLESGKYLLNQTTQFFSSHADGQKWTQIGEELLELCSTKYKDVRDVFIQNMAFAYLKTLGKLDPENSFIVIEKLLSYSISPAILIDALGKTVSLSTYTVNQKLDILLFLAMNCYADTGRLGEIGRLAISQLLNSTNIVGLTPKQLEEIAGIAVDNSSANLLIRDEIWKRTLKKSLAQFVSLVLLESQNKTEPELNNLATSIARIWHPQTSHDVRAMLSPLEQERKILAGKLWAMLISGKIDIAFDVRLDLLNDELARLEKEIKGIENSVLWLNQSELNAGVNRDIKLILTLKEMFSKKSSFHKVLDQLERKIKPSILSQITGIKRK